MCHHRGLPPDLSGHLYVNKEKQVFHCFRCGYSGRIEESMSRVPFALRPRSESQVFASREAELRRMGIFPLPTDPQTRVQAEMLAYLRRRNINSGMIRMWCLHYSVTGVYGGRVVFPCFGESGIEFFVARSIDGREPKTLFPPKGGIWPGKGGIVWGLDRIPSGGEVIICEGVFDAAVAPGGVAILGKIISPPQVQAIGIRAGVIRIMLDGDAFDAAMDVRDAFLERFPRVQISVVCVPETKDPSDLGPDGVFQLLNS